MPYKIMKPKFKWISCWAQRNALIFMHLGLIWLGILFLISQQRNPLKFDYLFLTLFIIFMYAYILALYATNLLFYYILIVCTQENICNYKFCYTHAYEQPRKITTIMNHYIISYVINLLFYYYRRNHYPIIYKCCNQT